MLLLSMSLYIFSCKQVNKPQLSKKDSYFNDDEIYFEEPSKTEEKHNLFTSDNVIYSIGKTFVYEYVYFDTNGKPFYFESKDRYSQEWELVPTDSATSQTVTKVAMSIVSRSKQDSSYRQSPILYKFITSSGEKVGLSGTGLVENHENIWIHPPMQKLFKILQLNPYPFIKKPYEIGHTYQWSLKIGDYWGNEKWKAWTGTITNRQEYSITKKENVLTNFGTVNCLKIVATGTSELGKTYLVSYFNDTIGFVKHEYINIDGSRLNMSLVKVI